MRTYRGRRPRNEMTKRKDYFPVLEKQTTAKKKRKEKKKKHAECQNRVKGTLFQPWRGIYYLTKAVTGVKSKNGAVQRILMHGIKRL